MVAQEVEHRLKDLLTLDHLELLELEQAVLPLALNKLFSLYVLLPQSLDLLLGFLLLDCFPARALGV